MLNPYQTHPGFGLRVAYAEKSLKDLVDGKDDITCQRSGETYSRVRSRQMDNCFENDDGHAVIWALMHRARTDAILMQGIERFTGNGFKHWERIANYNGPQLTFDL
jgi:hypothetical protein